MDDRMKGNDLFSIKQVSHFTHLPPSTLRFWEKEFPEFLKPIRTNGGQRRYPRESISIICQIKTLREGGIPISAINRKLKQGGPEGASPADRIDLLATRVAAVVKEEVYHFFKEE